MQQYSTNTSHPHAKQSSDRSPTDPKPSSFREEQEKKAPDEELKNIPRSQQLLPMDLKR
jgi:hypothetical protein